MHTMPTYDADQALETCMAKRRNLEQIFQAITDGIIAVNERRRIFHLNPAAEHLLGAKSADLLGSDIDGHLTALAGKRVNIADRALAGGEPIGPEALHLRGPRGAVRRLSVNVSLLNDDGETRGAVLVLHDETEVQRLRADLKQARGLGNIVGASQPMRRVFDLIREVARTDATVLIEGETGTGKELVANAIHQLSTRASGPMVTVNCDALPEGLLESELFGHVKGSFTGAITDRVGRFEMTDGGTLFLDEVADIPPTVQVKLLRVLQERTFERVGDGKPRSADVRLISATNTNLREKVARGSFREDLYYRLNVFPIRLPPLRERTDDLPLLVHSILSRLAQKDRRPVPALAEDTLLVLKNHPWPGNVRELQAAMEYALIRSHGELIEPEHLPAHLLHPSPATPAKECVLTPETVRLALERHDGNRTRAAASLGISRVTLWRKMKEWGIA